MIVVTGGAGFIGSNVVARLQQAGNDILVCDRLGDRGKWQNLAKRELAGFVPPPALLGRLGSGHAVQAVVHMGAISSTTVTDGDAVMRDNFDFSVALWQWCCSTRVPLIYASSAATYGDGSAGFADDARPHALAALRPLNLYGWSKHLFDRWVARQIDAGSACPPQWAGLKFFNVYGPNEYHKGAMRSLIAQQYAAIAGGGAARLFKSHHAGYEDGGQLRDFVYVRDCVEVICWLLANRAVSGLFNVGTGAARSFAELAAAMMHALGREPCIDYVEMPQALRGRYQYYTCAELGRLRDAGYTQAFTSLEDGVGDYVRNYLGTADPYL